MGVVIGLHFILHCNRCDANGMLVASLRQLGMTYFGAKFTLKGRPPPTICALLDSLTTFSLTVFAQSNVVADFL